MAVERPHLLGHRGILGAVRCFQPTLRDLARPQTVRTWRQDLDLSQHVEIVLIGGGMQHQDAMSGEFAVAVERSCGVGIDARDVIGDAVRVEHRNARVPQRIGIRP